MKNAAFRTLGRSGLVVSPLCLGTMTFGGGPWGADEAYPSGEHRQDGAVAIWAWSSSWTVPRPIKV